MGFVFVYQGTYFGRLHHGRIEDFKDAILGGEEPEDQDGPDGGTPHLKLVKST